MNKYKTFEKLKEELGDKFEEYMYKANIELLNKIDKAINYIMLNYYEDLYDDTLTQFEDKLLSILRGEE